ncbi:MAG: enoyl-CoA hydratase/isomerase family protein [Alphaproteobacteria bacterium]|nr:enoyl-CoA hydratase/isomerase family protein [Alphaproteobacteria bacterium]
MTNQVGASDVVTIEKDGRIAVVRFDRGDKANAMSFKVMDALQAAALELARDPELSAIVLTGQERRFTLGFDLRDPETMAVAQAGLAEQRHRLRAGRDMCEAWMRLEPVTIAAVEGWCVGGGVALAIALDLRVASSDAKFYAPEIERGMNMSWGSVPRMTALVGPARAKRLLILAEQLDAKTALDWGLIDEVAADGGALDAARVMAARIAKLPPVPVRMIKQGIERAAHPLAEALSAMDRDQFALAQRSEDYSEAVASFLEKRDPDYTGR